MSSNASSPGSSAQATTSSPGTSFPPSQPSSNPIQVSSTNDPSTSPPASSTTPTSTSSTSSSASPSTPTTAQSSPAQSSSPAAQTTPSSQAASASASASASSASASAATTPASTTSLFTSAVATTYSTTDAGGSVVYVTSTVPEVFSTSVSTTGSSGSGSNSHTGVIVGAVVGGVAGLVILVLLIFCIRKRSREDDFDGNFDPDRVIGHVEGGTGGGTLPSVDLAEEVTPFPRPYSDQGSMRQYGDSAYLALPSSTTSGQTGSDFYPPGTTSPTFDAQSRQHLKTGFAPPPGGYAPPTDMYGGAPGEWSTRSGGSPPPSTVSYNTSSSARGAKEREAMGRAAQGAGLALATQPEDAEGSGDVVVHQDAGRAPPEEHAPPPREIPPAYESIQQD